MSNIKDKLIEIAKRGVAYNATEFSDEEVILYNGNDFDHACEEIADIIIEKLPELLADSEWITTPFKIDDDVWFVDKYKLKVRKGRIYEYTITRGSTDEPCYEISYKDNSVYGGDTYSTSYDIFYTRAEAKAKLAELKGVTENE